MVTVSCRKNIAIGLLFFAVIADEARSIPITFAFQGTVDRVLLYEPLGQQSWPEPGTSFYGTYTFDSDSMDSSADEFSAVYTTPPPSGVRVQVGPFGFIGTGSYVATYNVLTPAPRDLYEAGNWLSSMELISHPDLGAVLNRNHFQLTIDGNTQLLNGLALPLTPLPLNNAFFATMALSLDNGLNTRPFPYVLITAELDSLTLVPEPTDLFSVGTLICVGAISWRRRKC